MIKYIYDETKNPKGRYIAGVPLGDITFAMYAGYKPHIQASVDTAGFYVEPPKPAAKGKGK